MFIQVKQVLYIHLKIQLFSPLIWIKAIKYIFLRKSWPANPYIMQLRREKHSLTKHDKIKAFVRMERKWKEENTVFRVFLWKAVSVDRFWKCWGCRGGFCGEMEQGRNKVTGGEGDPGVSRDIPRGTVVQGDPLWSTGEWGARSGTEELLHPDPLHCPFSHQRHWVWPLAVAPRARRGAWCDAQALPPSRETLEVT